MHVQKRPKDPTLKDMPGMAGIPWCGTCRVCCKRSFINRKDAKRAGNNHHPRKGVYRCPANDQLWHVGALPDRVKQGTIGRDAIYRVSA
jgi:hypothetical protein